MWDFLFLNRYDRHNVSFLHAPWNQWGGYMPDLAVKIIRIVLLALNFTWTVIRIMTVPFEQQFIYLNGWSQWITTLSLILCLQASMTFPDKPMNTDWFDYISLASIFI